MHGEATSSWIRHRLWQHLLPRHRLIAPDSLGLGLSDKPRDLMADVSAQAEVCRALLTRIGVPGYRILAGDFAATVTQELLARGGGMDSTPGQRLRRRRRTVDWRIPIAEVRLTVDAESFILKARLRDWEGDEQVFEQEWGEATRSRLLQP